MHKLIRVFIFNVWLLLTCFAVTAFGNNGFVIHAVRVDGLHYINYTTFMNYMPLKAGDRFTDADTVKIIDSLYKSGFFDDISIYQDANDLVIKLVERPVISIINISGNKKITTKQIREVMHDAGFLEGQVFNDALLAGLRNSLLQQYYNLGYYNAQVNAKLIPQKNGGVQVDLSVSEGVVAKIKEIRIIGNSSFKEKELLKNFSLSKSTLLSWFNDSDQYSKEKLDADLENLKSFYLDRGYLQFKVDSSQVSITPDKQHIYIIIHVVEGAVYKVSGFELTGNVLGMQKDLLKLIDVKKGEIFSRQKIINSDNRITRYLGDFGYAYAKVMPGTKLDDVRHEVFISFMLDPGKRVYVHRISFSGNEKTAEYVLRREMRQMEGGLFNASNVNESKRRLENLGYLKEVDPELKPLPGLSDETDLQYNIKEDSSAAASLNVGYSDVDHFIIGAAINERNFLGTGKSVGVQFNDSSYDQVYSFSYYDPYFTDNNISFGLNLYAQFTNQNDIEDVSDYSTNIIGGSAMYGFPVSDYSRLNFGYGFDNTKIISYAPTSDSAGSPIEVTSFINQYGNVFDLVKLYASWDYSNLDRAIFPNKGFAQSLGLMASVPVFGSKSLDYYKLSYDARAYYPMAKYFTVMARAFVGYGNGYGKNDQLPFFENYFAGGLGSVRGYETSTLGPLDSNGNAIGGNLATYGTVGLAFPNPLGDSVRTTVFFDIGNVFDTTSGSPNNFNVGDLRYSAGVQFEWHSVIPLVFSFAEPLNRKPGDREEAFQFTIGTSI